MSGLVISLLLFAYVGTTRVFFCEKRHGHSARSSFGHNSMVSIVICKVNIYSESLMHPAGTRFIMKKNWMRFDFADCDTFTGMLLL